MVDFCDFGFAFDDFVPHLSEFLSMWVHVAYDKASVVFQLGSDIWFSLTALDAGS